MKIMGKRIPRKLQRICLMCLRNSKKVNVEQVAEPQEILSTGTARERVHQMKPCISHTLILILQDIVQNVGCPITQLGWTL